MVYGGKPSRGCRTCRARRIKCDEGKPTCKRCEKSRRVCGGYRPEFEIVHRDQTGSTLRRLRKAADPHQQQQFTGGQRFVFIEEKPEPWRRQSPSPSPESALTVPLAHRASCHFASNFILLPLDSVAPHGFMEYLVPLIDTEPPGSALQYAFNACAFSLLGNRARADGVDLAQLSLKEHTLALAQTHKALGNPALAITDSTLAAVLLLSLYESITAIKESRMLAWRSHIDGAVHIVKTRGRDEMCQTKMGKLLFTAVRHHLISRVLSSGLPVPFGAEWWLSRGDTESLFAQSQRFGLAFSEVRTEANQRLASASRSPESIAQMRLIAKRVQALDQQLVSWLASIPDEFRFTTACWVSEDDIAYSKHDGFGEIDILPGRVDSYPDLVTAMAWNNGRVTRLLVISLHIRLTAWFCSPKDYRTTPEYEVSRPVCESIISDIIASVPYYFGWEVKGKQLGRPKLSSFACGEEGSCKALPGLFLIWSLTCVKNHDLSTEEQRAWAKSRLLFVAGDVGLKYAHVVNEANIRFPSMLIRRDGMLLDVDPLQPPRDSRIGSGSGAAPSSQVPRTPESLASVTQSPSSGHTR